MANFALSPLGNIDPAEVLSFVHLIEQWGAIIINVVLDIIKPVHTGIFQKAMLSTSEIFMKKSTTSNFKMAFTKVLA